MNRPLLWLILPLLAACGGGGSNEGSSGTPPTATPSPSPAPAPAPTPSPTPTPTPTPTPGDFFARAAALYDEAPDIAACRAGRMKPAVTAQVLATLNEIRRLHRLPAVGYSTADDSTVMAASLVLAANEALTHEPPPSYRCYTTAALAGTRSSNLYGGASPFLGFESDDNIMIAWLTDVTNAVADSVGHRRWLLDPFLGAVAYGRVAGPSTPSGRVDTASLRVFNSSTPSPAVTSGLPAFVAYPYEDYPARFFDTRALLSFGVIVSATNRNANAGVNYANATVTVRPRGGDPLAISNIRFDNQGFGLPNNIQFNAAGLQRNTTYDVTIGNVVVSGSPTSYSYYFRIT